MHLTSGRRLCRSAHTASIASWWNNLHVRASTAQSAGWSVLNISALISEIRRHSCTFSCTSSLGFRSKWQWRQLRWHDKSEYVPCISYILSHARYNRPVEVQVSTTCSSDCSARTSITKFEYKFINKETTPRVVHATPSAES